MKYPSAKKMDHYWTPINNSAQPAYSALSGRPLLYTSFDTECTTGHLPHFCHTKGLTSINYCLAAISAAFFRSCQTIAGVETGMAASGAVYLVTVDRRITTDSGPISSTITALRGLAAGQISISRRLSPIFSLTGLAIGIYAAISCFSAITDCPIGQITAFMAPSIASRGVLITTSCSSSCSGFSNGRPCTTGASNGDRPRFSFRLGIKSRTPFCDSSRYCICGAVSASEVTATFRGRVTAAVISASHCPTLTGVAVENRGTEKPATSFGLLKLRIAGGRTGRMSVAGCREGAGLAAACLAVSYKGANGRVFPIFGTTRLNCKGSRASAISGAGVLALALEARASSRGSAAAISNSAVSG